MPEACVKDQSGTPLNEVYKMNGKLIFRMTLSLAGLFGLCASQRSASASSSIDNAAAFCHPLNVQQANDLIWYNDGMRNTVNATREIICPIQRTPVSSTGTLTNFYVDGKNPPNQTTSCTIYSYNYDGSFLGAASFNQGNLTYHYQTNLTTTQAPTWAYVSLDCVLPPAVPGVTGWSQVRGAVAAPQ